MHFDLHVTRNLGAIPWSKTCDNRVSEGHTTSTWSHAWADANIRGPKVKGVPSGDASHSRYASDAFLMPEQHANYVLDDMAWHAIEDVPDTLVQHASQDFHMETGGSKSKHDGKIPRDIHYYSSFK